MGHEVMRLLITIVVAGGILWLVNRSPMPEIFKSAVNMVAIVYVIVLCIQLLWGMF